MTFVERILSEEVSRHSGTLLPVAWINTPLHRKIQILSMIKNGHVTSADSHRVGLDRIDFNRVKAHLDAAGLLRVNEAPRTTLADVAHMLNNKNEVYSALPFVSKATAEALRYAPEGPFYQKPNGGNRILPSFYTKLTDTWVRGSGQPVLPTSMNDGHLENTINLLKESHGNVLAKAEGVLGVIARHFANVPEVVEGCEELLRIVHTVDIEEQYPIFTALAEELGARQKAKQNVADIGITSELFDDTGFLKEW